MTKTKYVPPKYKETEFHCARCGVYAHQSWLETGWLARVHTLRKFKESDMAVCVCGHCKQFSFWHNYTLIVPDGGSAPLPHPDMPPEVREDFAEARSIVAKSPRGAAALLRLVVQKLMPVFGEKGKDINTDIANLVTKGLPVGLQQALDTVRVIGNDAVHPGELDLNDNPQVAQSLFNIVNMIVEKMITQPKELATIYGNLPQKKLDAIEKRDAAKT
ncbi:MAG: DUF4145 domain-containing protein [Thermoguttaceae bacterium]